MKVKDSQAEKKLSRLVSLKNSKDENIFKDCFYSENHALIIVIWKNHVDVTMLQKSILLIEERCFIYF